MGGDSHDTITIHRDEVPAEFLERLEKYADDNDLSLDEAVAHLASITLGQIYQTYVPAS